MKGLPIFIGAMAFATTALTPWAAVQAQTGDAEPQSGLEDIVVVAQRRAQNLQEVPIAITAVTAARCRMPASNPATRSAM